MAGHFAFAKLFKVRVIEFSIGAGARLWSATRGGTLYAIRALPILGYVRMGGMEAGDFEDPNGFHRKPAWQRLVILAAGPAANFVVAMVIITAVELTQVNTDPGKVLSVAGNSPAADAGLKAGDSVRTVNGQPFSNPGLIRDEEDRNPGAPVTLYCAAGDNGNMNEAVLAGCKRFGYLGAMSITDALNRPDDPDLQTRILRDALALMRYPAEPGAIITKDYSDTRP